MFKFADTQILSKLVIDEDTYFLAYSQSCEILHEDGYSIRYYYEQTGIDPYSDDCSDNLDFADLDGALAELSRRNWEHGTQLAEWLTNELAPQAGS